MDIEKLRKAAKDASQRISEVSEPHPILEIDDEERISIVVYKEERQDKDTDYFVISCNGQVSSHII